MANYTISLRQNPKPETRNPNFSTSFPYHSHVSFWMLINAPIYILSKDIKQSKALSSYFLNFYQPSTGSRLFRPILHIPVYTGTSSPGYRNVPYRTLWASHRCLLLKSTQTPLKNLYTLLAVIHSKPLYHSNSSPLGSKYSGLLNNPSSAHFPVIPSKIKSNMSCQTFPLSLHPK